CERIDEFKACAGTECHAHSNRAIQLHNRGWRELGERIVQRCDTWPVRFFWSPRSCMTRGDCGLERVWTSCSAELFCALERGETASDQELIPVRAVLIEQQDGLSRWAHTRPRA